MPALHANVLEEGSAFTRLPWILCERPGTAFSYRGPRSGERGKIWSLPARALAKTGKAGTATSVMNQPAYPVAFRAWSGPLSLRGRQAREKEGRATRRGRVHGVGPRAVPGHLPGTGLSLIEAAHDAVPHQPHSLHEHRPAPGRCAGPASGKAQGPDAPGPGPACPQKAPARSSRRYSYGTVGGLIALAGSAFPGDAARSACTRPPLWRRMKGAGCVRRWSTVDPIPPDDERQPPAAEPLAGDPGYGRLHELFQGTAVTGPGAPAAFARACVDLMDVSGASVSLHGDSDVRTLWWSSDDVARRLAEAEYTLGDGPCRTVMEQAAPVFADDLAQQPDATRWPLFAQQAVDLGVHAVFCLPLGGEALPIGTLDLYRISAGPLSDRDQAFAVPAADAITTALLGLQAQDPGSGTDEEGSWLDAAETDHEEVHQATGMIMVHLGVDPQDALARLRAHAFSHGKTVTEAAFDVIAGRIRFHD
ncbi:GAF and ANTAR domain-containing protein [Streptomyces sp. NPDC054840]